jgi:hypothetical protein
VVCNALGFPCDREPSSESHAGRIEFPRERPLRAWAGNEEPLWSSARLAADVEPSAREPLGILENLEPGGLERATQLR